MVAQFGKTNSLSLNAIYEFFRSHHFNYSRQLTALCEKCSKNGYLNISEFKTHLDRYGQEDHPEFLLQTEKIKKKNWILFTNFSVHILPSHLSDEHSEHATHCIPYLFGMCNSEHTMTCLECNQRYHIQEEIEEMTKNMNDAIFNGHMKKFF